MKDILIERIESEKMQLVKESIERLIKNKDLSLNALNDIIACYNSLILEKHYITFLNDTMRFYKGLNFKVTPYQKINYKITLWKVIKWKNIYTRF